MEYFIVSDIHGFYYELLDALKRSGFDKLNPNHVFVSCGDIFDRGLFPMETLNYVMSIPENRRILIRGNHEDLFCEILNGKREFGLNDIRNGTIKTIDNIAKASENSYTKYDFNKAIQIVVSNKLIRKYLDSTLDFAEIDNLIFTHGWIPIDEEYNILDDWRNASEEEWKKARWYNGMDIAHHGHIVKDKTIICGHYHCSWGWSHIKQDRQEFPNKNKKYWFKSFYPYQENGIIAIDSCVAYSGFINCIKIKI